VSLGSISRYSGAPQGVRRLIRRCLGAKETTNLGKPQTTFTKRQREQAKRERRQMKAEKRRNAALNRQRAPAEGEIAPDVTPSEESVAEPSESRVE